MKIPKVLSYLSMPRFFFLCLGGGGDVSTAGIGIGGGDMVGVEYCSACVTGDLLLCKMKTCYNFLSIG